MKKAHSFSLDQELILLLRRYSFVNWSKVVNDYLGGIIHMQGTDLEKLTKDQRDIQNKFRVI